MGLLCCCCRRQTADAPTGERPWLDDRHDQWLDDRDGSDDDHGDPPIPDDFMDQASQQRNTRGEAWRNRVKHGQPKYVYP